MLDSFFISCYPFGVSGRLIMADMLENLEEVSFLLDLYGCLLTARQQEYLRLYHEENCSLQEIADEFGVSRQGVFDGVRKAQKALTGYEEKLHLLERYRRSEVEFTQLLKDYADDQELCTRLEALWHLKD